MQRWRDRRSATVATALVLGSIAVTRVPSPKAVSKTARGVPLQKLRLRLRLHSRLMFPEASERRTTDPRSFQRMAKSPSASLSVSSRRWIQLLPVAGADGAPPVAAAGSAASAAQGKRTASGSSKNRYARMLATLSGMRML